MYVSYYNQTTTIIKCTRLSYNNVHKIEFKFSCDASQGCILWENVLYVSCSCSKSCNSNTVEWW